jgi:alpha-amylase
MGRAPRRRLAPAATVLAALLVAACGSSGPSATAIASPSAAVSVAASQPVASPTPFSPYAAAPGTATVPKRTVFVQLFEWKWTDVALECEQWLGPNGFAAVQVSPPNEHQVIDTSANHFPWWERYQAVSYALESRSGTRAEFADMVARCRAVGVEIYADVLLNHMSAGAGTGIAGTVHGKYDYPGLYAATDFHATVNKAYPSVFCDHSINDWYNPVEIQTCELSGLADLRTENPAVQEKLAAYMANLYDLGVRGYRIDAAKSIDKDQLAAILGRLRAKLPAGASFFVDQEVSDFGGDAVPKDLYYPTGSVDDFVYSSVITSAFTHTDETIAALQAIDAKPNIGPSDTSVVFVDNHDSQRGHIGTGLILNYKRGQIYALANVLMLAMPFGYPRVMSSFVFTDPEAGPPSDATGHTNSIYAAGSAIPDCGLELGQWVCEQRWAAIAGMVGFRDFTAASASVTDWWANPADGNQVAFGRGSAGFVVINRSTKALAQTLHTSLAPGRYCDVVAGGLAPGGAGCTGAVVTVAADGSILVELPPLSAVAVHVGARPTA